MDAVTYTEGFYGSRIPESKKQVASVEIVKLVTIVKNDLRIQYPTAESEMLDAGVLSTLIMMRQLGASSPKVYYEKDELMIKAFASGVSRVRDLLSTHEAEQERHKFEVDRETQKKVRLPVMQQIVADFEKYKQTYHDQDNPSLCAWKILVDNMDDYDLGGIGYYMLNWKIPQDNGIYNQDELIEICNQNPRLIQRSKVKLHISNNLWNGKLR